MAAHLSDGLARLIQAPWAGGEDVIEKPLSMMSHVRMNRGYEHIIAQAQNCPAVYPT